MENKTVASTNKIVRFGMWITVITAAIWAGGHIIQRIEAYLPYALGIGVGLMAIGLLVQFKKNQKTVPAESEQ